MEIVYYVAASLDGFIATPDGGKLAASFLSGRLITEYIVSLVPLVLGAGIPLFHGVAPPQPLSLVASKSYKSGIVQLRYSNA